MSLASARSITSVSRPSLGRQESENFLSYYGSSDAGRTYVPSGVQGKGIAKLASRSKEISSPTSSFSEYSTDSPIDEHPSHDNTKEARAHSPSDSKRRRRSIPSEGGPDRRRLAIVQMNSVKDNGLKPQTVSDPGHDNLLSDSLRRRRGLGALKGLALVAPPDASPTTYSYMTPPSSAPIVRDNVDATTHPKESDSPGGHQRSQSEAVNSIKRRGLNRGLTHKSSREVGIIGTGHPILTAERPRQIRSSTTHEALKPPIFQLPQSRSPSPGATSDHSFSSKLSAGPDTTPIRPSFTNPVILTPVIGQKRDIGVPVAAPVVVSLAPGSSLHAGMVGGTGQPVTPDVVVQQMPSSPYSPAVKSLYLNYQPGVHATAGPLPPPPRAIFNVDPGSPAPPRPPRLHSPLPSRRRGDMDAVKQALQLPPSVTAILASETCTTPSPEQLPSKVDLPEQYIADTQEKHSQRDAADSHKLEVKPVHRREGAISPSTLSPDSMTCSDFESGKPSPKRSKSSMEDLMADIENAIDNVGIVHTSVATPTKVPYHDESDLPRSGQELRRDDSWTDIGLEVSSDTRLGQRASVEYPSGLSAHSPHRHGHDETAPSPPSKSPRNSFRNSLVNLKRFSSLPRTPSVKSSSYKSHSSRTPSPPSIGTQSLPPPPPPVQKIKSAWPHAMDAADVLRKRNALDRSLAYAHKINELYIYDCGLHDWVMEAKFRVFSNQRALKRDTVAPSGPSDLGILPQPRHTSRSSIVSQATFPRRADATTATDLSLRPTDDITPPTAPPVLPYPSLAQSRQRGPSRSATVGAPSVMRTPITASSSGKSSGGFFASLGRKASVKREKGPTPTSGSTSSSSSSSKLTKNTPTTSNPRPIQIPSAPSVPGGPRAAPHRVQRSQTIVISAPFRSNAQAKDHNTSLTRRLSIMDPALSDQVIDIHATPEFSHQVDKLADLLPRADRSILAGYLRRAGQDIVAIGQYLEDEKNGTIRVD